MGRNAPCPCGTGRRFKSCCARLLAGEPAETPEALMRSRYTAYATGDVKYVLATTHPDGPHYRADASAWADELHNYCRLVNFVGLTVHEAETCDDGGRVRFSARFEHGAQAGAIEEHSRFRRVDGRWLYVDGEG